MGSDNATLFFTRVDEAHRLDRLFRTSLGNLNEASLIFEEPMTDAGLGKSQSEEYIFISLDSAITSEVHPYRSKQT